MFDFKAAILILAFNCYQCSAYSASASSETTWTMHATFPEYVVALATIAGSVLFMVWQCLILDT